MYWIGLIFLSIACIFAIPEELPQWGRYILAAIIGLIYYVAFGEYA